jgi:hypothetical protein
MSLAITAAQADVYRSVDAQGQVHYSDTPTPGSQLVHVQRGGGAIAFNSTTAAAAKPISATTAPTGAKANGQAQDPVAKQAAE